MAIEFRGGLYRRLYQQGELKEIFDIVEYDTKHEEKDANFV